MLSNENLLIVLRRQINFDSDQKAVTISQKIGRDRLVDRDQLFGHLWPKYWPSFLQHKLYPLKWI